MVSQEQVHLLGIKLIGLICLTWAIRSLFDDGPTALKFSNPLISVEGSLLATQWLYLVIPPVLGALGLYLIKAQVPLIGDFFGAQENVQQLESTSLFTIGVRLYGAYLIASYISTCLALLVNLAVIMFAASYMSTDREIDYIRSYIFPCLISISVGIFCFLKSRFITRLVYR